MKRFEIIENVNRAMENDEKAVEALYNYTYIGMYSLVYRLCHNKEASEEILQESYIAAFSNLDKLHYKGEFWKWLKSIVINKWRDYCKVDVNSTGILNYDSIEAADEYESLGLSPQEKLEKEERNNELWRLVNKLPENQRICMILYYYEDMSIDEIAAALNVPSGSIKSRLYYGRQKLRSMVDGSEFFSGVVVFGNVPGAESVNADMLAKILAALSASNGTAAATIASGAAVGSGLLIKICVGAVSALLTASAIGAALLYPKNRGKNSDDINVAVRSTSFISSTFATTESAEATASTTASTTASATTSATSTTTLPAKSTVFDYRVSEGGIIIEKYTGNAENVDIPSSLDGYNVISIGASAFKYCDCLRSVSIPGSVKSIGDNAFRECRNLTSVTFHGSVSTIGDMAFLGCDSLESISLPSGVSSIGIYTFAYCDSLSSVQLPEGVRTVDYCAFCDCPSLRRVTLPGSVTVIGARAFTGAPNVTLCVKDGTYSYDYAVQNGFDFEIYS